VAVKFVPIIAAGALLHAGLAQRLRQSIQVLVGGATVLIGFGAYMLVYKNVLADFWHATWGFQYHRESPFSIWGLYDWRTAQVVAQIAALALFAFACVRPRARDYRQVAAGMAGTIIVAQLLLQHWFYLYVPWFAGLVIVVMIARREDSSAPLR
jgi:hypothetical protein